MSRIERRSEAAEASGDAIQPIHSARATPFPHHSPLTYMFFLSLSAPNQLSNLQRPVAVRVFRARPRFRPLDAEERLIVAPFLSAAFTAAGNPASSGKPGKRGRTTNGSGRDRKRKRGTGTIDFSVVHVTTDELPLLAHGFSRALDIRSAYFLIRGEEKRREKRFYAVYGGNRGAFKAR